MVKLKLTVWDPQGQGHICRSKLIRVKLLQIVKMPMKAGDTVCSRFAMFISTV